jgi:hypothetical protein
MQGTILLSPQENTRKVEEEEKSKFLRAILIEMGLPIETIWEDDLPLTIPQKIQMRTLLQTYGVQVIDHGDGEMQILCEQEPIAKWEKCTYRLKKDQGQTDPKKQLYMEMLVSCWSVFEEAEPPMRVE